jgi:2-methylcitrate dehydratase PrpD
MDGNALAAAFIRGVRWADFPPAVQRRARMCLLDDLGAALAGTLAPISRISAGYALRRMPGAEAALLLSGRRASAPGAAFANANAANALDIDDDLRYTRGHPGAQLIAATLAVAEAQGAGGQAVLEALAVGYEIAARAGRCWHDDHDSYQACGSWGSLACAAVAARLMGLPEESIQHALGIADYHAPNAPMMRDIDAPAMSKHAIGWGAMNGVIAAELAEAGYTGIPSLLGRPAYHEWVADLGQTYVVADGVGVKRWCSCAWGHPGMAAAQKAMNENKVRLDDILHLKVETFHDGWRLVRHRPRTTEEAQFSLRWPLAVLLIDGEVGPGGVLPHRFDDPQVIDLFEKIEVVEDAELERMYQLDQSYVDSPDAYLAGRAIITLRDGRVLDSGITGRSAHHWDEASLEAKFRSLAAHVLGGDAIDRLVAMIWHFEQLPDLRDFTALVG